MNPGVEDRSPVDDRSPISKAIATASQVTTIGMTMVIPAIGGYFLDQWLGTKILFVILGLLLGVASSVIQLTRLIRQLNPESEPLGLRESPQNHGGTTDDG